MKEEKLKKYFEFLDEFEESSIPQFIINGMLVEFAELTREEAKEVFNKWLDA